MSQNPVSEAVPEASASGLDIAAIGRLSAVPSILDVCCRITGMGFAAIARVTEDRWIACAVRDEIAFGLGIGGELPVKTTLCDEVRSSREVIVFDNAAEHPVYANHHTPRAYGLQSYISMPIIRADGSLFGTLCAIDPNPHPASNPATVETFRLFAQLIAAQLDGEDRFERSEAALLDERETAELRDQFIAVLGHDLRNPLAAVQAGAGMLSRMELGDTARQIVEQMQVSGHRMSRLINDVLDFARGRLGSGLPTHRQTAVQLRGTMEQVIEEFRASHSGRAVQTELALARPVDCDPDRIAQLLSNLLANALTHGDPASAIVVRASTSADGLELSISNGGEPIPEAAKAILFRPFTRRRDGGAPEGLGLGLYIAAQIAEAHDGTLEVASDPSETRFTFRMPSP